jgi:hypothetical protein
VKRTWILAIALMVLAGLVVATVIVLRSPAYHARFVREDEITVSRSEFPFDTRGHARALLDAKARDEILPRALEEHDPDWKFRYLAIALVTTETGASEDELRVLVRCLDGRFALRWPAIFALQVLRDPRTLDALTARAVTLREEIERLPPGEGWHSRGPLLPPSRELEAILRAVFGIGDLKRLELVYSPDRNRQIDLESVRRFRREQYEERRSSWPRQVLPR